MRDCTCQASRASASLPSARARALARAISTSRAGDRRRCTPRHPARRRTTSEQARGTRGKENENGQSEGLSPWRRGRPPDLDHPPWSGVCARAASSWAFLPRRPWRGALDPGAERPRALSELSRVPPKGAAARGSSSTPPCQEPVALRKGLSIIRSVSTCRRPSASHEFGGRCVSSVGERGERRVPRSRPRRGGDSARTTHTRTTSPRSRAQLLSHGNDKHMYGTMYKALSLHAHRFRALHNVHTLR